MRALRKCERLTDVIPNLLGTGKSVQKRELLMDFMPNISGNGRIGLKAYFFVQVMKKRHKNEGVCKTRGVKSSNRLY